MTKTFASLSVPSRLGIGCLAFILVIPLLYTGARYFKDRGNYQKAHLAYQAADCAAASTPYYAIIDAPRLLDIGGYAGLAQKELDDCLSFQEGDTLADHAAFINGHPASPLAQAARARVTELFSKPGPAALARAESCENIALLTGLDLIPQPATNLPPFYLACSQVFARSGNQEYAFAMDVLLLSQFPNHELAPEAETGVLSSSVACERLDLLRGNAAIAGRPDFLPNLYHGCGQASEEAGNWAGAVASYQTFLTDFPGHALAGDVESSLARSLVGQARAAGAGEINAPESSGSMGITGAELAQVIIQNDSPESLRIVFSGPDPHIEELEACGSCTKYTLDPAFCPKLGPTGTYTLAPGTYDVVVEATSASGTTPWIGTWDLAAGEQYSNCFYIVTAAMSQ